LTTHHLAFACFVLATRGMYGLRASFASEKITFRRLLPSPHR
jgi:hypothetical protein